MATNQIPDRTPVPTTLADYGIAPRPTPAATSCSNCGTGLYAPGVAQALCRDCKDEEYVQVRLAAQEAALRDARMGYEYALRHGTPGDVSRARRFLAEAQAAMR